jgi:predicted kinase
MNLYIDMLMCDDCLAKEKAAIAESQKPENVAARLQATRPAESLEEFKAKVEAARAKNIEAGALKPEPSGLLNINNLVDKAREITSTITSVPAVFNAHTVELHKVYDAIDQTESVNGSSKQFQKSEYTKNHITTLQQVIFDANQTIIDANNKLRAAQGELNKLVLTLREDERAKLGITSPEYKPATPKTPKAAAKPRAQKKQKFDKKELMDIAAELQKEGLPVQWSMLQTICVARDMTPKQAADVVRKQMGGQ